MITRVIGGENPVVLPGGKAHDPAFGSYSTGAADEG